MPSVLIPLAEGFEELEAVSVIDILRRGGVEVVVAGLTQGSIKGSRDIVLVPDTTLDEAMERDYDMISLPGGAPGVERLQADQRVQKLLERFRERGAYTTAICAAPSVLASYGYLQGKQATSNPKFRDQVAIEEVTYLEDPVVIDGSVVTSRGPGTAMDFALTLVEMLQGKEKRDKVESGLVRVH